MTPTQVVFIIASALVLFGAVNVVTRRNLVHAALFLVVSLFGVAVLFVLLQAGFLAAVQVVVYIGAIAILLIMGVMVTRNVTGREVTVFNKTAGLAFVIALLVFFSLLMALGQWPEITKTATAPDITSTTTVETLGQSLFAAEVDAEVSEAYVIPTIVASVLLLGALIGSLVIAWPRKVSEE